MGFFVMQLSNHNNTVYPLNFNIFFPRLFHECRFKINDLLHASWHERDMYRGHELPPVLSSRTTHKVPVKKMWKTPKFDLIT